MDRLRLELRRENQECVAEVCSLTGSLVRAATREEALARGMALRVLAYQLDMGATGCELAECVFEVHENRTCELLGHPQCLQAPAHGRARRGLGRLLDASRVHEVTP
jgi:hypothetical protein